MSVIAPQTDIYLLKVPLEIDDINQLTFTNATNQFNYFHSLPKKEVDNFTYQRKDNVIRYNAQFDELVEYNYVMYKNEAYSNKWFYAFITNMEYVNDNMTNITIKTDCFQTWQFALNFKACLIDREHTNNDTVGANTLPEGLELGEFVCNGNLTNFGAATNYYQIIEVSQLENEGENQTLHYEWDDSSTSRTTTPTINGIPRGTTPLITELSDPAGADADSVRKVYDLAGLSDAIVNVYLVPTSLVPSYHTLSLYATSGTSSTTAYHLGVPDSSTNEISLGTTTFTRPSTVNGYTPKNNKVLSYPYCYFNISNNSGSSLPYHYEDFSPSISFSTIGTFGASGNVKTMPQNYKNIGSNNSLDYSVSGAKYPICSWKSDSYTNWLTQNAVNIETQWRSAIISAGVDIGGGALVGSAGGLALGAVGATRELINVAKEQHIAKSQANLVPDQVRGNLNAGDILWSKYRSPFTYLPMSIKAEYARCIDEYFSQFGYKCNRVKLPNITGRRNWNYVKTVGCYIEGNVPQEDLAEIKNMFDRGITLWHNPATFMDYSQNNDIIV